MSEPLIETDRLTKRYGATVALDQCTFSVPAGQVVGLLGPNGAGKTTLVRLLLGYLSPTSGTARIAALDCVRQAVRVRSLVAYLPGEPRLFSALKGRDLLRFFAEVRRQDPRKAFQVAERLELDLSVRVRAMSTGMRQKLALASVFSTDCPVLILDEPTSNLDPDSRATVLTLVREAQSRGATVLFSSHVLPEVEDVSHRVLMLRKGHVVADVSLEALRNRHTIDVQFQNEPTIAPPSEWSNWVQIQPVGKHSYRIECSVPLGSVLRWLASYPISDVRVSPGALRRLYDQYFAPDWEDTYTSDRESDSVSFTVR